jgi:hypothetical protein
MAGAASDSEADGISACRGAGGGTTDGIAGMRGPSSIVGAGAIAANGGSGGGAMAAPGDPAAGRMSRGATGANAPPDGAAARLSMLAISTVSGGASDAPPRPASAMNAAA